MSAGAGTVGRGAPHSVTPTPTLHVAAGAALIALVALVVYLPSLNGDFISDDYLLLADNPLIKAPNGLHRFWFSTAPIDYWPVPSSLFWVEWRLWGLRTTGYHVTNLILHVVIGWLSWAVLHRLSLPGAFLAAVLLTVHPVNVESVAWIAQRKTLLAMLFTLVSALCYLESDSARNGTRRPSAHLGRRWYGLSLLAFALAMLSKGTVGVFPLLLLVILAWLRSLTRKDVGRVLPFGLVAAVLIPVNMWFQARLETIDVQVASGLERLLGAGGVVWFYLSKAILPLRLAFHYPEWRVDVYQWHSWLPLSAALTLTWLLWRYRRRGSRGLLFAWVYFCVSLLPVLASPRTWGLVADHYQHLALPGIVTLVAAAWDAGRQRAHSAARWVLNAVAVVAAGGLTFLAWQQASLYTDPVTLYQATLARNPDARVARNNLGYAFLQRQRLQEAIEQLEQALRLKPDYADAHNNLGLARFQNGEIEAAIEHYEQALRSRPWLLNAHLNLGNALVRQRRLQEALGHFAQVLVFDPDHVTARNNLGAVLLELGRPREAIEELEWAVRVEPGFADAHSNLGRALLQVGQRLAAIEHYRQALQLDSNLPEVHGNLGVALAEEGRLQEAIDQFERALQLAPDDRITQDNLQEVLEMQRQAARGS